MLKIQGFIMVVTHNGVACGGDKRTQKLFEKAIENLVRKHGTEPSVLFAFIEEVLDDMLPGFRNANCRKHLAEKIRDYLLKYGTSPLPTPTTRNWNKYGAIFTVLAILVSVLLWALSLILQ
ncbi:MAG: hypothetical protein ACTSUO_05590 [Candidatus Thorarchaeota archaeon]